MDGATLSEIRRLIALAQREAAHTAVLAVVNVKSRTKHLSDYGHHSMRSSFLSDEEIDAVVGALRACGFYTRHFPDECDFFSWALSGGPETLRPQRCLVYTSALNGSGPGRRTLVPAFCAHLAIPTLNSDAYSCAINRHKFHVSRLLQSFGVNVPRSWYFVPERGWWDEDKPPTGLPIVAKATYEGSSLGVDRDAVGPFSANVEDRIAFLGQALRQPITVQALIPGYEVEVPLARLAKQTALGVAALSLSGRTRLDDTVVLYDDAWVDAYAFSDTDSLPTAWTDRLRNIAERAADTLNFQGISRIDFRVTEAGEPFVIDVSTTPHLTPNNSISFLFRRSGFRYEDIFNTLVALGLERHGLRYSSDQNSSSQGKNPRP